MRFGGFSVSPAGRSDGAALVQSLRDVVEPGGSGSFQRSREFDYEDSYDYSRSERRTFVDPTMLQIYNQLLQMNLENYQRVVDAFVQGQHQLRNVFPGIYRGYVQAAEQLQANYTTLSDFVSATYDEASQRLAAGYGDLAQRVMQTLGLEGGGWGVAAPAAAEIARRFAQQRGATEQQMISAGLGNTTVRANLLNQARLAESQAYADLGAQLAGMAASYMAQMGMQRLAGEQELLQQRQAARERLGAAAQAAYQDLLSQAQQARMQTLGMQSQLWGAMGDILAGYQFANTAGQLMGEYSIAEQIATRTKRAESWSEAASLTRPLPLDFMMRMARLNRPGGGGASPGGVAFVRRGERSPDKWFDRPLVTQGGRGEGGSSEFDDIFGYAGLGVPLGGYGQTDQDRPRGMRPAQQQPPAQQQQPAPQQQQGTNQQRTNQSRGG